MGERYFCFLWASVTKHLMEQNLAKREGGTIDRSQDIARLAEFCKLYRAQNNVDQICQEEMEMRELGAFPGNLGEICTRNVWNASTTTKSIDYHILPQAGVPWVGKSKVDSTQIPRPDTSSSVIMYETRHGNQANPPPPATSDFIAMDTENCSPHYVRCTINQVLIKYLIYTGMQLALLVQPLALRCPSEPVQIVDVGESGPI
ncbi:protein transport protein Sec24-like At4g32640 isoform X1 [Pistacia vera]|uniref:protein transport protein Sec24-like At4g32640 isoform X1 n=1 Tax=Pistacia vera TaxID=55513 RepID=UPI001262B3BD|nr:protein transport protein Sec24-like At4g32640 isoform X1 [Pistacia vera]XP_031276184.1 protein transport protein Sec24-like At4g32640 isoform X1 [Pistacia vera]XP_031276185.1 protein transport protein Sec24-like At4g32640 isoform X1 [Pistacia vera]XP_031276186.1 protein transport protein Sec24-like At4g32640 isoform X1 [Pistacia vera]